MKSQGKSIYHDQFYSLLSFAHTSSHHLVIILYHHHLFHNFPSLSLTHSRTLLPISTMENSFHSNKKKNTSAKVRERKKENLVIHLLHFCQQLVSSQRRTVFKVSFSFAFFLPLSLYTFSSYFSLLLSYSHKVSCPRLPFSVKHT